jgi:hypothetical protein
MTHYSPTHDDSLDNLSNLQLQRQRQLHAQVKQQFAIALQKLQSAETREIVPFTLCRASHRSKNVLSTIENRSI